MAERTFTWSADSRRYRDATTGRFVPGPIVRRAIDEVAESNAATLRGYTERLQTGEMTLAEWQTSMMQTIKQGHVASAAAAKGGWAQMSQADFGWTGQRIREQYRFLQQFAAQLARGTQPLDGRALRRAEMYGEAARATHREMERREAKRSGALEERNVLGAADHCEGCVRETRRRWVPIGTLVPVGARTCRTRCRCWIESRAAGEEQRAA